MSNAAVRAQAHLHHAYFLGLQLAAATRCGPEVMGEWMFRLFRRQHLEKFLSGFDKLGLSELPHAVACAQYHVLSNNIGGVGVEYAAESDRKAWVRFRYPRWMYHGPTICGLPVEVSRGFLRGWYAHNGVSLGNPRLGFVCVSEDMTGDFGFCGYFQEFDRALADDERLQFAPGELPPPFDANAQPQPPAANWNEVRLEKANRNYALEYVRNGLCELASVIGTAQAAEIGRHAARLIGLQYFPEVAAMLGAPDGDEAQAAVFLARMLEGMGDSATADGATVQQAGLRIVRGLSGADRALVLDCWAALWDGTMRSQQQIKTVHAIFQGDAATWQIHLLS